MARKREGRGKGGRREVEVEVADEKNNNHNLCFPLFNRPKRSLASFRALAVSSRRYQRQGKYSLNAELVLELDRYPASPPRRGQKN